MSSTLPADPLSNETIDVFYIKKRQCYITQFWTNSGPCVRTVKLIAQKAVCLFTAIYCQVINDCIVPLVSFLFLYTLSASWTLSFFLASHTLTLQNLCSSSQTHSFQQYRSLVSCTKSSDVQIYAVIFFTDFLLIFSYCSLCQHFS